MCLTQDAGAYGAAVNGGAHYLARLLRSAVTAQPAECHLMPCPRGSLSDLKFVPLEHDIPPPGSVKVHETAYLLCSVQCTVPLLTATGLPKHHGTNFATCWYVQRYQIRVLKRPHLLRCQCAPSGSTFGTCSTCWACTRVIPDLRVETAQASSRRLAKVRTFHGFCFALQAVCAQYRTPTTYLAAAYGIVVNAVQLRRDAVGATDDSLAQRSGAPAPTGVHIARTWGRGPRHRTRLSRPHRARPGGSVGPQARGAVLGGMPAPRRPCSAPFTQRSTTASA